MTMQNTERAEEPSVQLAATGVAGEQEPAEQSIALLVSRDAAARASAEARLSRGDPVAVQALITTLERENHKKPLRFAIGMAAASLLLTLLVTALTSLFSGRLNFQFPAYFYALAVGVGAGFAPTKLQRAVARLLSQQNDIRAVGPLSEALDRQDEGTKKLVAAALARLLPELRAGDASLLLPEHRKKLWESLLGFRDPALARGIFHAALETGDEGAVTYVQKLANGKGPGRKDAALRADASALLPALRDRVAEQRAHAVLLRPADPPAAHTLLRPAIVTGAADPARLLRPVEPEP